MITKLTGWLAAENHLWLQQDKPVWRGVMASSWGVVMTVDEPADLVLANVAWHLATGAREVHVYLDREDAALGAALAAMAGVIVTRCDAGYWAAMRVKARPELQTRRQTLNANRALARAGVEWLVHLDADEFLWQRRPLGDEMAALAGLGAELSFPVAERCYRLVGGVVQAPDAAPFAGIFRRSTKGNPGFDTGLFGEMAPVLQHGMLGHAAGKCAVPVGQDFVLAIHWSHRGFRDRANRSAQFRSTSTVLLHFDGLTPAHWVAKMRRYAAHAPEALAGLMSGHRRAQVALVQHGGGGLAEVLALQAELQGMGAQAEARFRALGLVEDYAFDPGGLGVDLSVAGFDQALAARFAGIFGEG